MMKQGARNITSRVWSEHKLSEELSEKLDELIFWSRYSAMKTFVADLRTNLRDDIDKLVYELSDGKNGPERSLKWCRKLGEMSLT